MNDAPMSPNGSGATIFFVLGALVVAVAVLAFFALGGNLGGGGNDVAALPPAPAPAPIAAPAAAPAPAPAPVVAPPATPVPDRDRHDWDRDRHDRDHRNDHDDHNDRNDRDRH